MLPPIIGESLEHLKIFVRSSLMKLPVIAPHLCIDQRRHSLLYMLLHVVKAHAWLIGNLRDDVSDFLMDCKGEATETG